MTVASTTKERLGGAVVFFVPDERTLPPREGLPPWVATSNLRVARRWPRSCRCLEPRSARSWLRRACAAEAGQGFRLLIMASVLGAVAGQRPKETRLLATPLAVEGDKPGGKLNQLLNDGCR